MKRDKVYHLIAGFLIASVVALAVNLWAGLVAGIAAGIAKEIYDWAGRGTASIGDAVATLMGAALGVVAVSIAGSL